MTRRATIQAYGQIDGKRWQAAGKEMAQTGEAASNYQAATGKTPELAGIACAMAGVTAMGSDQRAYADVGKLAQAVCVVPATPAEKAEGQAGVYFASVVTAYERTHPETTVSPPSFTKVTQAIRQGPAKLTR